MDDAGLPPQTEDECVEVGGSTLAAFISAGGGASVGQYGPLVHFGLTSEDINNISYSLMIKDATKKI